MVHIYIFHRTVARNSLEFHDNDKMLFLIDVADNAQNARVEIFSSGNKPMFILQNRIVEKNMTSIGD